MGEKFRKFVEEGTDCKYVPVGSKCCICGRKLGLFATGFWSMNSHHLSDAVLCPKCSKKLEMLIKQKRQWMPAKLLRSEPWKKYNSKTWQDMSLAEATELMELKEKADKDALSQYGENAEALFVVSEAFQIEPTALQVGIARAEAMQNRMVVYGHVEEGIFKKGDTVRIDSDGFLKDTVIIEAYEDDKANDFAAHLFANMGRQQLREDQQGWLVLDTEWGIFEGDRLIKL